MSKYDQEICCTENYIYDKNKVLGSGATCHVYLGRSRKDGTLVAVKQFSYQYRGYISMNDREIEMLRQLKHENTVKLLAVEHEKNNHENRVIIMDYCSGGSLHDFISKPENKFGLLDVEYLNLLKCLKNGLYYLRSKQIIHRDIKPGNIMLHISETGERTYKFTDFGAARELGEDEKFTSLHGTEEFLQPDMYRTAILRKGASDKFASTIDLWSLGVTLYHAATGSLPFLPHNYGRNFHCRETLYRMTTEKDHGVISGREKADKTIEYSKELPAKSPLSPELKTLITPILGGLLESKKEHIWSFEYFFQEADRILQRKPLRIFQPLTGELRTVYIFEPNIKKIEEKVIEVWGVRDSILFRRGQIMQKGPQSMESGFDSEPILCGTRNSNNVQKNEVPAEYPSAKVSPTTVESIQDLYSYVYDLRGNLFHLCVSADSVDRRIQLYENFVAAFHSYIQDQVKSIHMRMPHFQSLLKLSTRVAKGILQLERNYPDNDFDSNRSVAMDTLTKKENIIAEISNSTEEAKKCGEQYHHKIVDCSEVMARWAPPKIQPEGLRNMDYFNQILISIYESTHKVYQRRHSQTLGHLREIFNLDCVRAHNIYKTAFDSVDCRQKYLRDICSSFHVWLRTARSVLAKCEKLSNFLKTLEDRREDVMKSSLETFDKILNGSCASSLMSKYSSKPTNFSKSPSSQELNIDDIVENHEQLSEVMKLVDKLLCSEIFSETIKMKGIVSRLHNDEVHD